MPSCGEVLVRLLEAYGVDTVFGIPGVHTIELYRALPSSSIRHVTARHEQGVGFMADGYARVTGKPGVCFVITGPGMTNIATAMGQALADSVPMLVISSVNRRRQLGLGEGRLHELRRQQVVFDELSRFSHTLQGPEELPRVLARAFGLVAALSVIRFRTAIDDFGAGHAGLGLLADLPADVVKLDMALVRGVESSEPRRAIVEAVVGLCRRLRVGLIAEGVETVAELRALEALGVRFVQGFVFGRPEVGRLPPARLAEHSAVA